MSRRLNCSIDCSHSCADPLATDALIFVVAVLAGGVASITGFGIGSLLTPTFALTVATKVAVAAVSVPHVLGTALRFLMLRQHVDRRILITFGLTSAAGGLTGALLHEWISGSWLTIVFGLLLLFVATTELGRLSARMRLRGPMAWIAGALSGLLGGLVGNQGGIRSAALLGVDVPRQTFVATATAVGLIVDGARMPVYLVTTGRDVRAIWLAVVIASVGVIVGTVFGNRVLRRIPEARFRPIVAIVLAVLGTAMLIVGIGQWRGA